MRAIMRKHLQKRRETRSEQKVQKSTSLSATEQQIVPTIVPVSLETQPEPDLGPESVETANFDANLEVTRFDEGHPAPSTPEIAAEAYEGLATRSDLGDSEDTDGSDYAPEDDSNDEPEKDPERDAENANDEPEKDPESEDEDSDEEDSDDEDEPDDDPERDAEQSNDEPEEDPESEDDSDNDDDDDGDDEEEDDDDDDPDDDPDRDLEDEEPEEDVEQASADSPELSSSSVSIQNSTRPTRNTDEDEDFAALAAKNRAAIASKAQISVTKKEQTRPADKSQLSPSGVVMRKSKETIEIWPAAKPFFEQKPEASSERRIVTPAWQSKNTEIRPEPVSALSESDDKRVVRRAPLRTYDADDLLSPRMKAKKQLTQSLGDKLVEKIPLFANATEELEEESEEFDDLSEDSDEFDELEDDFDAEDGESEGIGACEVCGRDAIIVLFGKKKCEKCAVVRPKAVTAAEVSDNPVAAVVVQETAAIAEVVSEVSTPESVVRRFLDGRGKNTLEAYRRDLDAFTTFMQEISREKAVGVLFSKTAPEANALILDWLNSMNNAGLSSATVSRRLATLRSMVKVGRLLGAITWSLEIDSPKVEPYRDTRGPNTKQLGKLLQATDPTGEKGVRDRAMLLTTFGLGLRRAELASLRRVDYDAENKRIFVRGKGKKNLWLTVPDKVCEAIDSWMQVHADPKENAPLFCSLDHASYGTELSPHGVYYIVTSLGKKAGVKVKPHGLRHAAITMGLDATDGDFRKVQRFSRHANPKTLLIYDDNRQDLGADVANQILNQLENEDE